MIQQEAKQRKNQKDAEEYIHKDCQAFPRFYYQYMWEKGKVFLNPYIKRRAELSAVSSDEYFETIDFEA